MGQVNHVRLLKQVADGVRGSEGTVSVRKDHLATLAQGSGRSVPEGLQENGPTVMVPAKLLCEMVDAVTEEENPSQPQHLDAPPQGIHAGPANSAALTPSPGTLAGGELAHPHAEAGAEPARSGVVPPATEADAGKADPAPTRTQIHGMNRHELHVLAGKRGVRTEDYKTADELKTALIKHIHGDT